jgi:hypothetical protein
MFRVTIDASIETALKPVKSGEHDELVDGRPHLVGRNELRVGDVSAFAPPGDIHRVRNVSETTAVSVHTTAPTSPGSSSAPRRCYDWLDGYRK